MSEVMEFKGVIEGWVVNYLRRHFWRVEKTLAYDDVLQEARLVYAELLTIYPDVEPKHFMALFKTSWARRFTDLAYRDSDARKVFVTAFVNAEEEEIEDVVSNAVGETDCSGYLCMLIQGMPAEVRSVIAIVISSPVEVLGTLASPFGSARDRAKFNARLCQLIGCNADRDLVGEVERHFIGV